MLGLWLDTSTFVCFRHIATAAANVRFRKADIGALGLLEWKRKRRG